MILNKDLFHKIKTSKARNRENYILKLIKNKNIIDIGCVGVGSWKRRIKNGTWLHKNIADIADRAYGFDLDTKCIEELKSYYPNNIHHLDICDKNALAEINKVIENNLSIDYVICGEILEHLHDISLFFNNMKLISKEYDSKIVVTVPNVFSLVYGLKNLFLYTFCKIEYVHWDHVYWFSYKTISNLIKKHDFKIVDICFVYGKFSFFRRMIFSLFPHLCGSIMVQFKY